MAIWVKNIECPVCGSRDNRGVWDDGSTYCWGCHTYTPPTNSLLERYKASNVEVKKPLYNIVSLPEDTCDVIPEWVEEWLAKYDLTPTDFSGCQVLYSYIKELLIFAFYDDDNKLLMYQGRYFGKNKEHPKYITKGSKDFLCILGKPSDTIVVVEDLLSATKISMDTTVMPLFGSALSQVNARRLAKMYKNLVLWLDADKIKEALAMRKKYENLFDTVSCVYTAKDPKEYNRGAILDYLQLQRVD